MEVEVVVVALSQVHRGALVLARVWCGVAAAMMGDRLLRSGVIGKVVVNATVLRFYACLATRPAGGSTAPSSSNT